MLKLLENEVNNDDEDDNDKTTRAKMKALHITMERSFILMQHTLEKCKT